MTIENTEQIEDNAVPSNDKNFYNFLVSPYVSITALVLYGVVCFLLGTFWVMMTKNLLFSQKGGAQEVSVLDDLPAIAKKLKINKKDFAQCMDEKRFEAEVTKDLNSGQAYAINSTPGGFLINVQTKKAISLPGAAPIATFDGIIKPLLEDDPTATYLTTEFPLPQSDDHYLGSKNAKIVLIEYSDFQCPYCKKIHPTITELLTKYPNDFAVVFRHFPLESIHPKARPAAEASECIASLKGEEAFWEFVDLVFK